MTSCKSFHDFQVNYGDHFSVENARVSMELELKNNFQADIYGEAEANNGHERENVLILILSFSSGC